VIGRPLSGASLHIVHINSTCLRDSLECLAMWRERGSRVGCDDRSVSYIAGMTAVNSALFNPGWREKLGIDYGDLVLPDTGEHLTKERFEELHIPARRDGCWFSAIRRKWWTK